MFFGTTIPIFCALLICLVASTPTPAKKSWKLKNVVKESHTEELSEKNPDIQKHFFDKMELSLTSDVRIHTIYNFFKYNLSLLDSGKQDRGKKTKLIA